MKRVFYPLLILIVIVLIWLQPLNVGTAEVTIPDGATARQIAEHLALHRIVRDKEEFIFLDATPRVSHEFARAREGRITREEYDFKFHDFFSEIETYVETLEGKRIVLDPIVPLAAKFIKEYEIREYVRKIINTFEKFSSTTLITTEILPGAKSLSRFGVEELFVHGIIVLGLMRQGNSYTRTLLVRKMRGTDIDLTFQTYSIRPKDGIVITGPLISG